MNASWVSGNHRSFFENLMKYYWHYWDRSKLLRSNSLNSLRSQSQIKVWMIECLAYACQAGQEDSGCVAAKSLIQVFWILVVAG